MVLTGGQLTDSRTDNGKTQWLRWPFLADWFHGLSDHLMFLFCSTAWIVCMMC